MPKYALLRDVMDALEAYESQGLPADLPNFAAWLAGQYPPANPALYLADETRDGRIAHGIGLLYKLANNYARHAFQAGELNSFEEFGYLAALLESGPLSKTALIELNYGHFPSGNEVIKRLQRKGFISSRPNPEDGRSVLLHISPEGRMEFFRNLERMQLLSSIVAGKLSDAEKAQLLAIMDRLIAFHHPIYHEQKGDYDLGKIASQYL